MESRDRAAQAVSGSGESTSSQTWVRLIACSVFLVGLAVVQDPGLLVPDTKFDLVQDPGGFLSRALHLWDGEGAFGQVQNQAYGYLWPMGPFFLLGDLLGTPGWFVQRAWLAVILVVAFLGVARLSRALGVRSDLACILAGFAYALSPRMLSILGSISIEAWPSAVAPWVLLPLVVGAERGSPRRAAALSGLAVAMIGGVNAAATFAVLPLGAVWLLTRSAGPRRRSLMTWWPLFTLLGTLWWLIPLFVLGSYSPPFLDYIESADVTTFPTTLFDALRGTSNWVPYLDPASRAGNDLLRQPALIVESGLLLLLGLAGMARRGHSHRVFLSVGTLVGLFLVTMGHTGSVEGLMAGPINGLLDGTLAPLRNVHKFDPVIRLPLTLGLALFVDSCVSRLRRHRPAVPRSGGNAQRVNAGILVGAAVLGVAGAALPVAAGRLTPSGGFVTVPDYWQEAASWLEEAQPGTTLLVPGSSFGTYVWGTPRDEPMQWLAESRWAVRNAVPLAPPGNIRMLDEIERRINSGSGSPALASYLRRAGVRYLLVRNDLARGADVSDPVLVHQALNDTPQLQRVASFGPSVGGEGHLDDDGLGRLLINGGWQDEYPALEIFAVPGAAASVPSVDQVPVVVGGPEDLATLADLGILDLAPTVLGVDTVSGDETRGPLILTDGLRATERSFGRVHDGRSATLVEGQTRRLSNPTGDYQLDDSGPWMTYAELDGAMLSATSSASDANNAGPTQPGRFPFAAVDPWTETEWRSNIQEGPAVWRADFPSVRSVETVGVRAGRADREVIRVRTQNSLSEPVVLSPSGRRTIRVDDPATSWVEIIDASDRAGHRLALADVSIPNLEVTRSLRLPAYPETWGSPDTIALRALQDARKGCVRIDRSVRCFPDREIADEEPLGFSRRLSLPASVQYDAARVEVKARPGDDLSDLILQGGGLGVSASSTGNPDPRAGAVSAVDGNPATAWSAALSDLRPTLRLRYLGKQRITGIRMRVDDDVAVRLPTELLLRSGQRTREVSLDDRGRATFPPLRTDQIDIVVREAEPANSLDFASNAQQIPVGIGEVSLVGVDAPNAIGRDPVTVPCGFGPVVTVNGTTFPTSVEALPLDLLSGEPVEAQLCGPNPIRLSEGENQIVLSPTSNLTPVSLVLGDRPASETVLDETPIARSSGGERVIADSPGEVVAVPENVNRGFRATADGRVLTPVTIDGWQQGWRQDGVESAVSIDFAPDLTYRIGLLGGLVAWLLLVGTCLRPARRWGRSELAALGHAQPGPAVLGLFGIAVAALLAGPLGVAVGVVTLTVGREVVKRQPDAVLPLVAATLIPAVAAYVLRPWGGEAGWAGAFAWPHYCVLAACLIPLVAAGAGRHGGGWSFRRMNGSSTTR